MYSRKSMPLPENPRERANPLSIISYWYTMPLFFKGFKKPLKQSDLYKELKEHKSEQLGVKLSLAWEKELVKKTKYNKQPSLLVAALNVFGMKIVLYGIALAISEFLFKIQQPSLLGNLIIKFQNKTVINSEPYLLSGMISLYYTNNRNDIVETFLYGLAIILTTALHVASLQYYMMTTLHLGMKIRLAMCSMIYRKSLKISKTALGDITVGQIVNLISNDVGHLDSSIIFLHFLWIGPLGTIIMTYFMYKTIGVAAFAGIGVMLIFIPLEIYLGQKTAEYRWKTALLSDERFRLMNEIIEGIQVIKMYAWEKSFSKLIEIVREKECNVIQSTLYIRGILLSFAVFLTRLSIYLSLVTYALLGYYLSAEKAFVIYAYYFLIRRIMTSHFPQSIVHLAESLVSLKRIENFMQYNEIQTRNETTKVTTPSTTTPSTSSNIFLETFSDINSGGTAISVGSNNKLSSIIGIELRHVKAKWNSTTPDYTLDNINLKAQPGTLTVIIGPVGAGKSSLLLAILGELPVEEGKIEINGSISYASQEPWLFSGTIRQNILFGLPIDNKRYQTVLKKCALKRDLELMPNGDKTLIGERGSLLSGGQKARISLARAVYRKSVIYLLDDPLSAVDINVGQYLFDECINDFLRRKIVILVTHQLQFLVHADQIIILNHGKINAMGSYETLRNSGLDFTEMSDEFRKKEDFTKTHSLSTLRRFRSKESLRSIDSEIIHLEVEEEKKQENIDFSLYKKYIGAGGNYCIISLMIVLCILAQLSASGSDRFLAYMVKKETIQQGSESTTDKINIYIFTILTIATIFITISRNILFFKVAIKASRKLHNAMFNGVTRATMYFFNTNPSGRILNRFSKDMGQIDEVLPTVMLDVTQNTFQLLGVLIVLALLKVYFIIAAIFMIIIIYLLRIFYLRTSLHLKRIESITRSPIYSHLSASLNGLSTIRAFGAEKILVREFDNHQDLHSSAFYMFISTSRAFGFWVDFCSVLFITIVTMTFFIDFDNAANVGLAITQALSLTGSLQWGMRQSAEMEHIMTAVERVVEYQTVDQESELRAPPNKKPPIDWPQNGKIKFEKLSLRYSPDPDSNLILKSLDFEIAPKEKVGIVGRTGAGKSSLINALFRLSYTEGTILIDDIDIYEIGLHDLRTKISIIPQEPVLFSGTMRYNLDPFNDYSDDKLWETLDEVKLKDVVAELPMGLQGKISEGGTNFSVGQRQLICLARAILRENKILVMDEATANVDPQTDSLIQATIRSQFKDCTVLTIAHRLQTVMDSDKVLVIDDGQLVEFGTPYDLLTKSEYNIFKNMVKRLGKSEYDAILLSAENAQRSSPPDL